MPGSTSTGLSKAPYRKVEDGKVTDEVIYISAMDEGRYSIGQANMPIDADGRIADELTNCRKNGDFILCRPEDVDLIDVSPKQLVSVAAALIPFLENDDANRALMGSNMQRQAVPLIRAEAPLVGTGMEETVARDFGRHDHRPARRGRRPGRCDPHRRAGAPETSAAASGVDIYNLLKFQRSNQNTCINQRPLVKVGAAGAAPATSSPTGPRPSTANWRSAATCCARSCRGTATISRTRS